MGGWRNAGALAAPCALIVNPRLVGLLARGLLSRLERDRTHIREENLLMRAREDLDGLFQRHPFHRLDIVHRLAAPAAHGSPIPKLHNFHSAIRPTTPTHKQTLEPNP